MADSQPFPERYDELHTSLKNELGEILRKSKLIVGPTTRFILNTMVVTDTELIRKEIIGEKNDKPRKVVLMVGETGSGKTSLINAMINYILGVRWEHKIWLEAAEANENQTESQTTAVTVYEVYAKGSPFSLTVIDTPGQGDTRGLDKDKLIPETLQLLFRSEEGIHEIDAVCLVLKATDARLHERQLYILDEVLSLFGKDIEKHITILITNANKTIPKKALACIKEAKIPCAKTTNDQPVYFKFNNCQSESYDEEDREIYKESWDSGIENFQGFFAYLNGIHPKSLNMTEGVLRARKQLDANVNNFMYRIKLTEIKKQELTQTKEALNKLENYREKHKNFEYEVDEPDWKLVKIKSSWWHLTTQATRCTVCKENCHYPGCWWVSDLSKCSVMSEQGKCIVCTEECLYTNHKKDDYIYEIKTKRVTRTKEDLKKKYENDFEDKKKLETKLENEIKCLETEKIRLVEECYQCFERLMETALKSTSMSSIQHLDFIIEKMKETGKQERVLKLEELKRRAQEENKGLFGRLCHQINKLWKDSA
uniref:AAA+ ATPase domain-containing protein n=1 Tax=Cyprinus carpio TaxID=7962 RepID=A0A8C2DRV3_CYPCA